MTIIWLLVGLGLIVLGADWLVEGASSIARKAGVSEFVIGLTIVGFGTSCPELVVSLTGALEGNADVAVGNVLGSNIFNVLFILGLTALLCPVSMSKENRERDIPPGAGDQSRRCPKRPGSACAWQYPGIECLQYPFDPGIICPDHSSFIRIGYPHRCCRSTSKCHFAAPMGLYRPT